MRRQITYVEPVIFIFTACLFLGYPTTLQMVLLKVCWNHFNGTYCDKLSNGSNMSGEDENMIQEETSSWILYLSICSTIPSILATLVYSTLSDIIGRKKVMFFPIIGEFVCAIFELVNARYFSVPLIYLLIGNLIRGFCGNFGTLFMCTSAYVSDTSGRDTRTQRVTALVSARLLGSVLSYIFGGLILKKFGFVVLYCIILFLLFILMVYLCFLKESYKLVEKSRVSAAMLIHKIQGTFGILIKGRGGHHRKMIFMYAICLFFLILLITGFLQIYILFLKHQPLNFDSVWIGYFSAEVSGMQAIGATFFSVVLIRKLKWNDSVIIGINFLANAAFMLCIAFSSKPWHVFVGAFWCLGNGVGIAAVLAGLTKMVSNEEQGMICSFNSNIEVLCTLITSIVFPLIYEKTLQICPSFVFYLMSSLSVVPFMLTILLYIYERKVTSYELINDFEEIAGSPKDCVHSTNS